MTSRNQRKKQNARKRSETVRSAGAHDGGSVGAPDHEVGAQRSRRSDETKSALRTTELIAYAAVVLAVIMTALAVDADGEGGRDPFGAETAIRYITYLTIGYLLARGLAKSGSWRTRSVQRLEGGHDRTVVVEHVHEVDHDTHADHEHDHVEAVEVDDVPADDSTTHEDENQPVASGGAAHRP